MHKEEVQRMAMRKEKEDNNERDEEEEVRSKRTDCNCLLTKGE
jgi:NADPH-dependent 7-cyano-7-deazaguanine reductase QueF